MGKKKDKQKEVPVQQVQQVPPAPDGKGFEVDDYGRWSGGFFNEGRRNPAPGRAGK